MSPSDHNRGYASRAYAESLDEFGELLHLPRCDGYLLKRPISGSPFFDAMGCYPLFFCRDWSALEADLAALPESIVSVSLVADPYAAYTPALLKSTFDHVVNYKQHYVIGLENPLEKIGTKHHRREARLALRDIRVERCIDPAGFASEWDRLYDELRKRYEINGIRSFSLRSFERLLSMPEIVVLQAFCGERMLGAQLYFIQDDVVHCHLGAVNKEGYTCGAFYALDYASFEYFSGKAKWLDIGGGAGLCSKGSDGLSRYKQGWSSELHPVYFCGRIINPDAYRNLSFASGAADGGYFPAYRAGEFG
ncbi:MAG: hypothetical protein JXR25_12640 [Pontiellaceae bacterium]|nr:hypothetical protein [Pontiellaceae bacterium]MBN2785664.1 hypothetical protein [Pontiellaceae bacterium]